MNKEEISTKLGLKHFKGLKQVSKTSKVNKKLQTPEVRSKRNTMEENSGKEVFYLKSTSKISRKSLKSTKKVKSNGKAMGTQKVATKERVSHTSSKTDQPNFFAKNSSKKVK